MAILRPGAPLAAWQVWPYADQKWPTFNVESDQADGLVLWLPLGIRKSPNTHIDRIGGLGFTESGTPVWQFDSDRGWSLYFNSAATEYLTVPKVPVTVLPFTITTWFRPDALGSLETLVALQQPSATTNLYRLRSGATPEAQQVDSGGNNTAAAGGATVANVWQHAAGTFITNSSRAAFLNGRNKGTDTGACSGVSNLAETNIAALDWGGSFIQRFGGRQTDIRIYNRILTDGEMAAHYDRLTRWDLHRIPRRVWAIEAAVARRIFITHC